MDLKTAYQIMDVEEGATVDELDEKYMLWIRKEKAQQDKGEKVASSSEDFIDIDRITEAYQFILNQNNRDTEVEYGTLGKIKHYVYYYKFHVIGILFVVIFAGLLINTFVEDRIEKSRLAALPDPDFEVLVLGSFDFPEENISSLEAAIKSEFSDWENVKVTVEHSLAGADSQAQLDYAERTVLLMTLREEQPDIYLVDENHYDILFDYELYSPLNIDDDLDENTADHLLRFDRLEGGSEQLYGVDLAESDLFNDLELGRNEIIASIREESEKHEEALQLIEKLLQE
ncbi:hypothetical protein ACM26V_14925 [Salipaludibacillus sp. HK11]|uniref:hypothetical protein n=1 Tax=Salipaludibacillus sp. HK11 TaxID=3394320 RepID=UPI0039FD897D